MRTHPVFLHSGSSANKPRTPPSKSALLAVTPFCTPNYAYPAPAYLARYLRRQGIEVAQADLSLELMLRMLSNLGLQRIFAAVEPQAHLLSPASRRIIAMKARYLGTIDAVIRYLQGRDNGIAYRLCQPGYLPRGDNFELNRGFEDYDGNGNTLALHDRAKFVATLYLYDLGGLIRDGVFPYFQMTLVDRLYDSFVHLCTTFDAMLAELERPPNAIDEMLHEALDAHLVAAKPDLVGVSVPFARNLYWALRIGRRVKELRPATKVVAGGGLFNTSMRKPSDPRLFDFIDYLTLDDGEQPIHCILEHLAGDRPATALKRTFLRTGAEIQYSDGAAERDVGHSEAGAPDYRGYRFADYFATLENNSVSQRVRSDGWWNKMTMAHGCYWKKCAFCDIHLSYIGDYDAASAANLVDKIEECIAQTGHTGFHFVDEALPPKVMRDFALEVLRRGLTITWHGMLRFDKTFTPDLCRLLSAAGLVAVFGGLEVASNRLLGLMKKGTSVEQVATVAKNFQEAGTRVHAYLMYGFPSQTPQETIDAMDVVRQLFKHGVITSASWAKFGVTPHSPIGRDPAAYGIELKPIPAGAFIEQILTHSDPACDHDLYSKGLLDALRFWSQGFYLDLEVEKWFAFAVPTVSIDRELVAKVLADRATRISSNETRRDRRVVWLGGTPRVRALPELLAGEPQAELILSQPTGDQALAMPIWWAEWFCDELRFAEPTADGPVTLASIDASWRALVARNADGERTAATFAEVLDSPVWRALRAHGLTYTDAAANDAPPRPVPVEGGMVEPIADAG